MIREILRTERPLIIAGAACFVALAILAVISLLDSGQVMGINRWIKPMKFAMSIGVYLWTLTVFLYFLPGRARAKKIVSYTAIIMMLGELVLIVMQAARGTTSHFNNDTAFDGMVFSTMGLMIVVNTGLIIYLTVAYFRADIQLARSVVWGMRLGLILLLASSFEGAYMSVVLRHSVGVADGGPGLPFVNWSTEGGDLRAAHFIGMHALQVMPIAGYVWERLRPGAAVVLTILSGASYFLVFTAIFLQAMAGRPLWGVSN